VKNVKSTWFEISNCYVVMMDGKGEICRISEIILIEGMNQLHRNEDGCLLGCNAV
jgi:hypothetical protein